MKSFIAASVFLSGMLDAAQAQAQSVQSQPLSSKASTLVGTGFSGTGFGTGAISSTGGAFTNVTAPTTAVSSKVTVPLTTGGAVTSKASTTGPKPSSVAPVSSGAQSSAVVSSGAHSSGAVTSGTLTNLPVTSGGVATSGAASNTPQMTVAVATSQGTTASESYKATVFQQYTDLSSTLSTSTSDSNFGIIPLVIFPAGLAWFPVGPVPPFVVPPPTVAPNPPSEGNPNQSNPPSGKPTSNPANPTTNPVSNQPSSQPASSNPVSSGKPSTTGKASTTAKPSTTGKASTSAPATSAITSQPPIPDEPTECSLLSKRDLDVQGHGSIQKRDVNNPLRKRLEVDATAVYPLQGALQAIGGGDVVANAQDLALVVTRFPAAQRNRFISGLQGRVTENIDIAEANGIPRVQLKKGDLFRIRWDFDDGAKGVHVNAEFFGSGTVGTTKIAFRPKQQPLSAGSSTLYDQVVKSQSHTLGYDTKPNTDTQTFTPEERTGENLTDGPNPKEVQQKALQNMAKQLAQRWQANGC